MEKIGRYLGWLFITMASTSVIIPVYLIKTRFMPISIPYVENDSIVFGLHAIFYLLIPIFCSWISFELMKWLGSEDYLIVEDNQPNIRITPAETTHLPIYLGYFFVALSIPSNNCLEPLWPVLIAVYLILNILLSLTEKSYFNPLIMFRYNFYNIVIDDKIEIMVISKKDIVKNESPTFPNLLKITESIFIDKD